jgi:hypothetical protein
MIQTPDPKSKEWSVKLDNRDCKSILIIFIATASDLEKRLHEATGVFQALPHSHVDSTHTRVLGESNPVRVEWPGTRTELSAYPLLLDLRHDILLLTDFVVLWLAAISPARC